MAEKILIRSTNWIGDAVMTLPAVKGIKQAFPQHEIHIMAKPWVAPVFENNPDIDEIIIYDKDNELKTISSRLKFLWKLRKNNYDLGIVFPNSFSSAMELYLAGCRRITGYEGNMRNFLLTDSMKRDDNLRTGHEIFYYIKLIEKYRPGKIDPQPELFLTDEEIKRGMETIRNHNLNNNWIAVSPGAFYGTAKMWGFENFSELCDSLWKRDIRSVILGGEKERELGEKIKAEAGEGVINLAGKTELREMFSILYHTPCFLTNDSGPMHIAAALKINTIAVFGSTNPYTTGPWNTNARIARINLECSPCKKRECPLGHTDCMKKIPVEMVENMICEVLESENDRK